MKRITFGRVQDLLDGVPVDEAILVGGQALNAWAEHYGIAGPDDDRGEYGPAVSRDIDFLARRLKAVQISDALGAAVAVAGFGDITPNSAKAIAMIDGDEVEIDFLNEMLGFSAKEMEDVRKNAAVVPHGKTPLLVMHPLHCLQAQLANVYGTLNRRETSNDPQREIMRVNLAIRVCREAVAEYLDLGELKSARAVIERMFELAQRMPYKRAVLMDTIKPMLEPPLDLRLGADFIDVRFPQLTAYTQKKIAAYIKQHRGS